MKLTKEQFISKTYEMAGNTGIELNNNQLEKLYLYKEKQVFYLLPLRVYTCVNNIYLK